MARVNIHVPDDVLEAFRNLPGGDAPSISSMATEALRRFIALEGAGNFTLTQRVDTLQCDLETLVRVLRAQGISV